MVISKMDARQRTTPKALQEDSKPKTFREAFSQAYRDNPPDFTVKRDVANKYGVSYFLSMMFLQYYGKHYINIKFDSQILSLNFLLISSLCLTFFLPKDSNYHIIVYFVVWLNRTVRECHNT